MPNSVCYSDVNLAHRQVEARKKTENAPKKISKEKPNFKESRNWCFTDFELLNHTKIYNEYSDIIRYICYGRETCPKTKKVHIQGWIQFINKKRLNRVKSIFGSNKIHLESCRGSESQNDKYCAKENNFVKLGVYKIQGQRTDLEDVKKTLDKGGSLWKISQDHFSNYIRYTSGFKDYKKMVDQRRTRKFRKVAVEYVHGATGTGKTRTASEENLDAFKITGSSLQWFDGYNMEKTLIIDEYNNDVGITTLLNLLDGYQLRLPVKGSFTYANWNKVVITSNNPPSDLHTNAREAHREALFRRITTIRHLCAEVSKGNTITLDVKSENKKKFAFRPPNWQP